MSPKNQIYNRTSLAYKLDTKRDFYNSRQPLWDEHKKDQWDRNEFRRGKIQIEEFLKIIV